MINQADELARMAGTYETAIEERLHGTRGLEGHRSGYIEQGPGGSLCRWGEPHMNNRGAGSCLKTPVKQRSRNVSVKKIWLFRDTFRCIRSWH